METSLEAISAAFECILPKGFAADWLPIDLAAQAALTAEERVRVASWGRHRQLEFAAGRHCARRALEKAGFRDWADLTSKVSGVPVWPEAYVGSISHCRGLALAVAASSSVALLLGVDLEKTNRISEAATKRVVHPQEESFVAGDQVRASILFSLKEAFYKAQYPRDRTNGNFHDLILKVDSEAGTARAVELAPCFQRDLLKLQFAYRVVGNRVVSLCWAKT
jgi:enterobactin synthetase component D